MNNVFEFSIFNLVDKILQYREIGKKLTRYNHKSDTKDSAEDMRGVIHIAATFSI
jgi:hypothetical protein